MADVGSKIFTEKAAKKLRSPDDLDRYVQVANPGSWVVFLACAALLAGLLIWAFFGSVSTSVTCTGTIVDDTAMCFLTSDEVKEVAVGNVANVKGETMVVDSVAATPVSRDEAHAILKSDYLVSSLVSGDWAYQVTFAPGEDFGEDASSQSSQQALDKGGSKQVSSVLEPDVPLEISIVTRSISPASLVLGKTVA